MTVFRDAASAGCARSGRPQASQNRAPAAFSRPHELHCTPGGYAETIDYSLGSWDGWRTRALIWLHAHVERARNGRAVVIAPGSQNRSSPRNPRSHAGFPGTRHQAGNNGTAIPPAGMLELEQRGNGLVEPDPTPLVSRWRWSSRLRSGERVCGRHRWLESPAHEHIRPAHQAGRRPTPDPVPARGRDARSLTAGR